MDIDSTMRFYKFAKFIRSPERQIQLMGQACYRRLAINRRCVGFGKMDRVPELQSLQYGHHIVISVTTPPHNFQAQVDFCWCRNC
jgi:hypothetical protein